jgi:hypothetical protein
MVEVRVPTPRGELSDYLATPTGRAVAGGPGGPRLRRAGVPQGLDRFAAPLRASAGRPPGLVNRKEVGAMRWDLGPQGLGLLIAMSLGFGVIAQLVGGG